MAQQGDAGDTGPRTLAEKLGYLFSMVKPESQDREYSGREVVAGVRALGIDLSTSHLSELRRGVKTNPTVRVLQGLADFFQIKMGYFFDDHVAEEVQAELELRAAMRDAQVRDLAFRISGLPDQARASLYRLLTDVLHEQYPRPAGEQGDPGESGGPGGGDNDD